MTAKRLTERIAAPFTGCRVNRDTGTISGVLLCGTRSVNGRDYPLSVFRRDYAKYEGKPVNCDHGREATVDRRFGWISDVAPGADGRPRGTLNCLKSHPMYERVMEAAERNPKLFGFSHVAICQTRPGAGGREVVESIDSVESIDLVAEPATTRGFFEGKSVSTTVRQLAEALVKHPQTTFAAVRGLKWLAEMDGTDAAPASMDAPADDADPGTALDQAFIDAAVAELRACMAAAGDAEVLKKCLGKLKKMLQAHAEIAADSNDDTDGREQRDEESEEGRRVDYPGLIRECRAAGFLPSDLDLKALAALTAAERTDYIRERRAPERPTSAGRGRISEAVTGRVRRDGAPPADGKAFAEWVS